ncbi:hypothetical protein FBG13_03145 [Cobetia marina]|uniref:Uncharacterized protein n=1 Tax=Halomonas qinghailakensis TaxID=2937790 RepID=A0AA46TQ93_9GAMM|nr:MULTISPECIES: hypothetical protein [Halomonadaceae]TKD64270.1 hypothetical protein FBG13_03145 [Cobetia marina]UYO74246.1 hypothetical protein M0220_15405 [Halomonas sp. ZZQ-149]
MAVNLKNVRIVNCGTGISAPADAPITADGLNIEGCERAIDLRDPPSLMQQLGLAEGTPPKDLLAVLEAINKPDLSQDDVIREVSSSKLRSWLGVGSDITTVSAGIFQLYQSGLVQSVLTLLPK